eukprot:SAG31_NODE_24369_length_483_cov_0.677083_1_plen_46_part_01
MREDEWAKHHLAVDDDVLCDKHDVKAAARILPVSINIVVCHEQLD